MRRVAIIASTGIMVIAVAAGIAQHLWYDEAMQVGKKLFGYQLGTVSCLQTGPVVAGHVVSE